MTDTCDKIIEQLQRLAVLHFLADPDKPDGSDPVIVLANARRALDAETWESLDEAAERMTEAHADKLAELKADAAREGQDAAELLGEEMDRTANRQAQIVALEKELAERISQEAILRGELADAARDANAPVGATYQGEGGAVWAARFEASERAFRGKCARIDELEAQLATAKSELEHMDRQAADASVSWAASSTRISDLETMLARARGERDLEAQAAREAKARNEGIGRELDTAWEAFPSRGAVRGMVSLADVVEGLVGERDALEKRAEKAERECGALRSDLGRATAEGVLARAERYDEKRRAEKAEGERDEWRRLATHRTSEVDALRDEIAELTAADPKIREATEKIARLRAELELVKSYPAGKLLDDLATARSERDTARKELADLTVAYREAYEVWRATVAAHDAARAEIEAAWAAYPVAMSGSTLAEVVAGLSKSRDEHRAQLEPMRETVERMVVDRERLLGELAAALRPEGWECSADVEHLAKVAHRAYTTIHVPPEEPEMAATAKAVCDEVLANLHRKAAP